MKIGAQFYTLRDFCRTAEGLEESLKRVADIGYRYVQISGTCEYSPEWLSEKLKQNGLQCVLTHYDPNKIKNQPLETVQAHRAFDCSYIGVGCMPGGFDRAENYGEFVGGFLPAAEVLKQNGCLLMYHNHQFEFMKAPDGRLYFEKLAEDFSPELLGFTLDTYWVQYGGGDSADWLNRLSGRVPCIHLKDMACVSGQPQMAPVGGGNINFDAVFKAAESAGTKYMLVEQDNCNGEDPFDCLKRSYEYLKSRGF